MALSLNQVIIGGYLGNDPEVRNTNNGREVASMRVATTESWGGGGGRDREERTEWHNVTIWDENNIKYVDNYLRRGDPVIVTGRLQTRKWTKDGQDHYTTEIVASRVQGVKTGDGGGRSRDDRDDRGGGRDRDRGRDREGRDRDRGSGGSRDDRGRDRDRGRDDRRAASNSNGDARDRGRDEDRGSGGPTWERPQHDAGLEDEIPF